LSMTYCWRKYRRSPLLNIEKAAGFPEYC
jgi:hypothetical protein